VCVLIERDETISERVNAVVVLREGKKALTKRSLGAGRHIIFNVVVAAGGLTVEAAAIGTTKALVHRAVKPHHHVEPTGNKGYWGLLLGIRLGEQLGLFNLRVAHSGFKFFLGLVATEGLL
jgi:hypothetical protein